MPLLKDALNSGKALRVLGFDDAPFDRNRHAPVAIAGVLCSMTRFEGMLWREVERDGQDATDVLIHCIKSSKFYPQIHAVLTDGLAFAGFNLIDLPRLSEVLDRPCIAVMRKLPNMQAIDLALRNFSDYARRKSLLARAGEIYPSGHCFFQVSGCEVDVARASLEKLTDRGHVPEALRLAHLIGSAVMTGESSNRA